MKKTGTSATMKENNGRAARRKHVRRLMIISATILALLTLAMLVLPRRDASSRTAMAAAALRQLHLPQHHIDAADNPMQETIDGIRKGYLHLIDIETDARKLARRPSGSEYAGITGVFCRLQWDKHKADPSSVPMFRDLVTNSPDCLQPVKMDLQKAVGEARSADVEARRQMRATPKVLNLTAVVFHESRCGSTLVANMCVAANPTEHRVYSESTPPIVALKNVCGESYERCPLSTAAKVLEDVMYLMSRSDDEKEQRVFFKIQSLGTRNLEVFQTAYPKTPWLFVYREPVQVLMSQLSAGVNHANCVRGRSRPGRLVERLVHAHDQSRVEQLSGEDYCAAHLASITETAVERLNDRGIPVNYKDLPGVFWERILPSIYGRALTNEEIARMQDVSSQYSKGRGKRAGEFTGDSEQKEKTASEAVRAAAAAFLASSFAKLEAAAGERQGKLAAVART